MYLQQFLLLQKKFLTFWPYKSWIRTRIRIDLKCWIRIQIRIDINTAPKHWFKLKAQFHTIKAKFLPIFPLISSNLDQKRIITDPDLTYNAVKDPDPDLTKFWIEADLIRDTGDLTEMGRGEGMRGWSSDGAGL
jgi:hypothetical protein